MPGAPIRDVPKNQVGRVVQAFVDNAESRVEAIEQANALFTVIPGGSTSLTAADSDAPLETRSKKKSSRKKKPR